ncbi:AAA family ATPase [Thermodesulfobacterium sp. TA1]|uniref:ExeA family protein n=1 Tax=Thermodesulfobacterium sp. TA1 TaxID=2234087 RepID=UPI001231A0DD|nr:AAA family ATPase [Thermodesulfobacterium sp. TA1]QER42614.1 AAA family ATPase [Thermodesulfobacterium sp. TA1]
MNLWNSQEKQIFDYLNFFGLKEPPFSLTPDPNYFFPSSTHIKVIEVLKYGFLKKEGFMVLTGEPGLGKTLLIKLLLNLLPESYYTLFLLTPTLSPNELIITISQKLKFISEKENPPSKETLLNLLQKYLEQLEKENKTLLIIIDEAQNLPIETLEELRLLSNFETERNKLIQFFLVGQPLLTTKLKNYRLYQLSQRITIWENITPFNQEETAEYVRFRLFKAGYPVISFERGFEKLLYKFTQGIPRLINKLMDRTLLVAYAEKSQKIKKKHLKTAKRSFPDEVFPLKSNKNWLKFWKR